MTNLIVSGMDFSGAYERTAVILALADIISQDNEDKPIIALTPCR